jgi:polyisoprenoid-binding protein YceI
MSARLALRNCTACLLLLCACSPALSEDVYDIDPRHTFSFFEFNHWGLSRQRGRFDTTTGHIAFNAEAIATDIRIEIDSTSVSTGSGRFDRVLRSDDFFDVENYPKIIFQSSRLQFEGEHLTEVEGALTIRDITRPLTLKVERYHCRYMLIYGAHACGANGIATILRSDFNMSRYTPFISDQIVLHITVEAIKRLPPAEQ